MINPNRPVAYAPRPHVAVAMAPIAAGPGPVPEPLAGSSGLGALQQVLAGIVAFIKRLFGGSTAAAPAAADVAQVAQAFGLRADAPNVAAFQATIAAQRAEPGVIGPGVGDPAAIRELQQLLGSWGLAVPASGTFDAATAQAVMDWKQAAGLVEGFRFADGRPGVTPFVDERTKGRLRQRLQQTSPVPAPALPAPLPPPPPAPPPPVPVPAGPVGGPPAAPNRPTIKVSWDRAPAAENVQGWIVSVGASPSAMLQVADVRPDQLVGGRPTLELRTADLVARLGLAPGATLHVQVQAYNADGLSDPTRSTTDIWTPRAASA